MDIKSVFSPKIITMRHEEKFICSEKQMFLIESRMKNFLKSDYNQNGDFYNIRSVYFDTINDRFLKESISGCNNRNKYRIRIYNCSKDVAKLEKKTSVQNLKTKNTVFLNQKAVEKIINNEDWLDTENKLLQEFYCLQRSEGLSPKVIVEYERTAYVEDIGNIRITLDKNIRGSADIGDFYEMNLLSYPIQSQGYGVIEVKYDSILPGYISRVLDIGSLQKVSFSKYGLCRNIIENNGRIEEYYEL